MDEVKVDPNVKAAIGRCEAKLGTQGADHREGQAKGGRIEIEYYYADDLDRIYTAICGVILGE